MSYIPYIASIEMEISQTGKWKGKTAYIENVIGRRDQGWSSTSVLGDVAQYLDTSQAVINRPTTGQTLYLVSTNANDNSAGSGARSVRILYLDASGNRQVRTDSLNGTTPVSIGSGYSYILYMEVADGAIAAGNIAVSSTNGAATTSTTFERISTGNGRSMSARYKVPTGYTAFIDAWDTFAVGNTMDSRLRATVFSNDRTLSTVHHFQDTAFVIAGASTTKSLPYLKCPEGSEIKVSSIPGAVAVGNRNDVSFSIIVVQN